jgi:hypothetical protein
MGQGKIVQEKTERLAVGKLADMMSSEADSAGTRAQVGRAFEPDPVGCWRAMSEAGVSETELAHSDAQACRRSCSWGTGEVVDGRLKR